MIIMGVDPGVNGALAWIDTETWTMQIADMPDEPGTGNRRAVCAAGVIEIVSHADPAHVICELVHSSPQMGVASAFSFGRSLGIILGATPFLGATMTLIKPQVWKSKMRAPADKNKARARACQLFPAFADQFKRVKDADRAEAAMLALFGCLDLGIIPDRPITPGTVSKDAA